MMKTVSDDNDNNDNGTQTNKEYQCEKITVGQKIKI